MNFQIKKIILWPKNVNYKAKEIEFKLNKINIITGASRTGKSAIIPIIDYCLASGTCHIPVKTIRNACSWFGILIQTNNKEILLARREPGIQKSTDDMYIAEGSQVIIPEYPKKNTNRNAVKKYLDELASLTFLDLESDLDNNFYARPSFRDLVSFCFQPQNIVANPNTLLYKADTTKHRTKLINIFPYILGAVTPEVIAKRNEINILSKEVKRKEKELARLIEVSEKWKTEINGWLSLGIEFGLLKIEKKLGELTFEEQLELLNLLAQKNTSDAKVLQENIKTSSQELVSLREEENRISFELTSYQKRYTEMTHLINSIDNYREALTIQVERLNISKWLKSLSNDENTCPIFGNIENHPKELIEKFYSSLMEMEEESTILTNRIPASFEREYENVKTEISKLTEQLKSIQKRIQIQSNALNNFTKEKYTYENISRFLGQIQYVTETFNAIGSDNNLKSEIDELNDRLNTLRSQVNEFAIKQKINAALRKIEGFALKLLPYLDTERPNDPIEIDYENLTIKVKSENGRDDYLWEIGSGSNWLSYHISATLAFQMFFNEQSFSPVPNFIVYDQPSQVYFPQKLAIKESEKELDPKFDDEDRIAVRKIFLTMSKALKDSKKGFQLIVLEHANKSIWGGINGVHEVCEWRGENNKLIPEEWIR